MNAVIDVEQAISDSLTRMQMLPFVKPFDRNHDAFLLMHLAQPHSPPLSPANAHNLLSRLNNPQPKLGCPHFQIMPSDQVSALTEAVICPLSSFRLS
jgi:hypothetical protein